MNIYVSHLSWGTSSEGLGNLFMQFGEVASANVITDRETGRSRGFGFVEMPNEEEGQKAIDQLNGTSFEGQTITVNVAPPPAGAELTPGECERFEALRVWRDRRAAEMGCKPFVIASNRDLLNVARSGAASPADLLSIAGFGSRRAERYGEEIVAVLGSVAEADFD